MTAPDDTTDRAPKPEPKPEQPWCKACDSYFNLLTNTCRCNYR
ncbi:hypothetical protein ACX9I7_00705 [Streptomyces sp. L500]